MSAESSNNPQSPPAIPPAIANGRPPSQADGKGPKEAAKEIGGPKGPEPTRYGDWEVGGRCTDF